MRARGFSLVELMIASLLGLLVIGAAGSLFLQGAQVYREGERGSRMRDELHFALAQLGQDLEMSGFWGEARDPASIVLDAGLAPGGDCGPSTDGAPPGPGNNWLFAERRASVFTRGDASPAQAHAAFPCISSAEFYAGSESLGTDVIAIKRVAGSAVAAAAQLAGHVYLRTDGARSTLYRYAPGMAAPAAGTSIYEYRPALWYLRRYSMSPSESPKIPALCRKVLVDSGGLRLQSDSGGCIASGIEDLQLEFGLDTDDNGLADVYTAFGASPTVATLAQVVCVRVQLLARTTEADPRYTDLKTFLLGGRTRGPFRDGYRRRVLSGLVVLNNPARLRAPRELP